jgi:hypothetical protein
MLYCVGYIGTLLLIFKLKCLLITKYIKYTNPKGVFESFFNGPRSSIMYRIEEAYGFFQLAGSK